MRILTRIVVIVGAYACSLIAVFAALAVLFGLASMTSIGPGYWTVAGVSPVIFASAPIVGLFFLAAAIALSAIPMLTIIALAETFHWRSVLIYAVPSALLSAAIYWTLSPRTIGGLDEAGVLEIAVFSLSGALSGLTYWAIAGRKAGAWRRPSAGPARQIPRST